MEGRGEGAGRRFLRSSNDGGQRLCRGTTNPKTPVGFGHGVRDNPPFKKPPPIPLPPPTDEGGHLHLGLMLGAAAR